MILLILICTTEICLVVKEIYLGNGNNVSTKRGDERFDPHSNIPRLSHVFRTLLRLISHSITNRLRFSKENGGTWEFEDLYRWEVHVCHFSV
jgi:hypothetical protein